jgi:glycosyltransferase involved in cell wall biosynthesis
MKKVLLYRNLILPRSETFIRAQALALREWSPVMAGRGRAITSLDISGIEVQLPEKTRNGSNDDRLWRICRLAGLPHPSTVKRLRRVDASLCHVHFGTDAVDIWPSMRRLGLPTLVTLHGYDINTYRNWWESGRAGWRRRSYPSRLLRMSAHPDVHFIAVSEAIRERAMAFGLAPEKVTLSYIGVDPDYFSPGPMPMPVRDNKILFVGRLVENKGPRVLIDAFARFSQRVPESHLVIVGEGPLEQELRAFARQLGADVRFAGALDRAGVRRELHSARILCQPSITLSSGASEGLGISILEAQACGVPVLTSARGGSVEGIRVGRTGFSFAEGDAASLAQLLEKIVCNDDLLASMSIEAVRFVREKFELASCTRKLEEVYDAHFARCRGLLGS